ncbi:hypothetical protein B2J93_6994 [Marssonina coronariae]|uniref:Amino acid transporter transmembrane domain-containing protein n=1 Tax=Diplocarpon coronariae TaxID=2795749 RepID=A0A218ZAC4_9HELO|nr:hypothetical protein B2J93_6994 [Marssonina coronariae]
MSWQKAACLPAGDQVCLAIMAQTWSLSVLGWVPGIITMIVAGILFWSTLITMQKFIMKHLQIKDICDFAYYAFGKSQVAYELTGLMLLANNILLIRLYVLTGAKIINARSDHSMCTVIFSIVATIMGKVMSGPRTLNHIFFMSMFSAGPPNYGYGGNYPTLGEVKIYAFLQEGVSWVACMNAVPNITFFWVPQILFPTFIPEMERPQDFPKALAVLAVISTILFIVPLAIGFHYLGQYSTAPAFGSLGIVAYKKASFAVVIVPTMVIGVVYANVTSNFIYFRILGNSRRSRSHTLTGYGVWAGLMVRIWAIAFVFAEVVLSMGDFPSLLGAAFDSFFGFLFFAVTYWQFHKGHCRFRTGIDIHVNDVEYLNQKMYLL